MPIRSLFFILLLGALLVAPASCRQRPAAPEAAAMPVTFESVQALPARAPDREVRYGAAASQRIVVWHPDASRPRPAPVVVLLHGGCWLSQFTVDHIGPLATALAAEGFGVWAPEYRRVGEAGAGWPGTFEDVARAIDALADSADSALDTNRIVLVGHSAGGHLALWAAARGGFAPSHPLFGDVPLTPRGVIGLAAITDLVASAEGTGACRPTVPIFMGGAPADQSERYLHASPVELPRPVPVVILHGSGDAIVPTSQARAMPDAHIRFIEGAGHFDLIHPHTPAFPVLLDELRRLLGDA